MKTIHGDDMEQPTDGTIQEGKAMGDHTTGLKQKHSDDGRTNGRPGKNTDGNAFGLTASANGERTAARGGNDNASPGNADNENTGGYDSGQEFLDGMADITAPALEAYREMAGDHDMTGALWRQWSDMMVSIGINPESPAARIPAFMALNIITNDGTSQDADRTADDRIDDAIALSLALCEHHGNNDRNETTTENSKKRTVRLRKS